MEIKLRNWEQLGYGDGWPANESMDSYIGTFERKVSELKKDGIDLNEKVLAMQLLDTANIDAKEAQMVFTGFDFQRPDEMFNQMKREIHKFFGEQVWFRKQGFWFLARKSWEQR